MDENPVYEEAGDPTPVDPDAELLTMLVKFAESLEDDDMDVDVERARAFLQRSRDYAALTEAHKDLSRALTSLYGGTRALASDSGERPECTHDGEQVVVYCSVTQAELLATYLDDMSTVRHP